MRHPLTEKSPRLLCQPPRRRAIARQATTIAAVIELRRACESWMPGVSEALRQSWQRCSRQALVRRMSS